MTFTHTVAEATAALPLCRCVASPEALTTLGFAVEVRVHCVGAWHVAQAGMPARRALSAATEAGLVTMLCHCGAEQTRQRAHRARVAAGVTSTPRFVPEALLELVALGAVPATHPTVRALTSARV